MWVICCIYEASIHTSLNSSMFLFNCFDNNSFLKYINNPNVCLYVCAITIIYFHSLLRILSAVSLLLFYFALFSNYRWLTRNRVCLYFSRVAKILYSKMVHSEKRTSTSNIYIKHFNSGLQWICWEKSVDFLCICKS